MPTMNSSNDGANTHGVHGLKISTVVPARVTGENVMYELSDMDLVMKHHSLRGVYYFKSSHVTEGLSIYVLKEPMFRWLEVYYAVSGRMRRSEGGRPFIKCNDSGVRIVEAKCKWTLEEWLKMKELAHYKLLVPDKVLGPDLPFSPLVYLQFTRFKCGGLAVGLSWSHLLGDAASAAHCINLWGQILSGNPPLKKTQLRNAQTDTAKPAKTLHGAAKKPLSVKQQLEPVGDCWATPNKCKMGTFSFKVTEAKMKHLQSKISNQSQMTPFQVLSALIWHCMAKIRNDGEPKLVTICRSNSPAKRSGLLSNELMISTVSSDFSPAKVEVSELAALIDKQVEDDMNAIEKLVDRDSGAPDFIVYGANLTFVDLEDSDLYGLELKGQNPVHVQYWIDGVGDEGAVLVYRSSSDRKEDCSGGNGGRMVTLMLAEDLIWQLKKELQIEWGIA